MTNRNTAKNDGKVSSTELASERTRLARRRTRMANERTFAAWMRTGLGSVGGGFALVKIAPEFQQRALTSAAGVALMGVGILMQIGVARESRSWLASHELVGLPSWILRIVVFVLLLASAALLVVALVD